MSAFSQSLGDIARQQRFLKPAPTAHVITNEDIAAQSGKNQLARADITPAIEIPIPKRDAKQQSPDDVQAKILTQKQKVKALEDKIAADKKQLAKHDPIGNSGATVYERVYPYSIGGMGSPGVTWSYPSECSSCPYDWANVISRITFKSDVATKSGATNPISWNPTSPVLKKN